MRITHSTLEERVRHIYFIASAVLIILSAIVGFIKDTGPVNLSLIAIYFLLVAIYLKM